MANNNSIIIIAGEPSADMHGANLVKNLKLLNPNLKIYGIGSAQMHKAGVEIFADITQYAVIGFLEVLKHIQIFKKIFNLTLEKINILAPKAVVLIDFPGFNLKLAKAIKKKFPKTKIIYYISPQLWAWGKNRIVLIKNTVDKMIVIFEFEKILYEANGIDAQVVPHPLLEIVKYKKEKNEILKELKFTNSDKIIALLPGSREIEVKKILPLMLKAAKLITKKLPNIKFILLKASNIKTAQIKKLINKYGNPNIKIIDKNTYDYLHISSFAWVCSGTATLETALLTIPMVIVYKTSFITWLISKFLIQLPYIGLVNIVAGKKIIPELIQYQATPKNIISHSENFFLINKNGESKLLEQLNAVREILYKYKNNKNAAQIILQVINSGPSSPPS